ncbi:MAG: hypothetical protein QF473_40970, partial [Planctomycetota bacterium]|nr:hypothetical protein [Planctomycetota bacterium]
PPPAFCCLSRPTTRISPVNIPEPVGKVADVNARDDFGGKGFTPRDNNKTLFSTFWVILK